MSGEPEAPYQALYRRFRPQRFADVLGQGHVTRALQAAVRDGKVAHAYLFSGPRGTGKTSTARILAMALNCERPEDGEPCGECSSCVAIRTGASLDVVELDSATNRGIDEMRDLLSRVALGTPGRWKVYIVDEVHQITSAAASALLKTLEEPPGHVIFVLATTDPQKVLETIRSRTQHFEFRLLGSEVLTGLLSDVARRAAIELPPEAIDVVVRRGHGSARDALSALDQVAAAGGVEDDASAVSGVVEALVGRNAGQVLVRVAEAAQAGLDPRRLGTELLEYLRNGFLATRAPSLVLLSEQAVAEVEAHARQMGPAALVRAMDLIGQALIDMRDAADARTTLEVALVRLSAPEVDDSRAALVERIERLERALAGGAGVAAPAPAGAVASAPNAGGAPEEQSERQAPAPAAPASTEPAPAPAPAGARPGGASGNPRPGFDRPRQQPATERPSGDRPRAGSLGPPPPLPSSQPAPSGPPPGDSTGPRPGPAERPVPTGPRAVPGPAPVEQPGSAPPPPAPPAPVPLSPATRAAPAPPASSAPSAAPSPGGGAARPAPAPGGEPPSREELTVAWGDRILQSLRPAVKVYVATGRFLPSEGAAAVYAVPDRGLLTRAEANRAEVEAALQQYFGRPVPLKLVLDDGSAGGGEAPPARPRPGNEPPRPEEAPVDDPSEYDWAQMEEASAAVVSPEQRLLEAFPGAEEVQP